MPDSNEQTSTPYLQIPTTTESTIDDSTDWRGPETPEDMLSALDSLYSYDDFSGRAIITASPSSAEPMQIDLMVQGISMNMGEHIMLSEHVGDTFGITCFGKAPLIVNISATLVDWDTSNDQPENFGKKYLVDAWKNALRLEAVSRTGMIPTFRFLNNVIVGPFLSMKLTETSANDGIVNVNLEMLATSFSVINETDMVVFDYTHGVEAPDNLSLLDGATEMTVENVPATYQENTDKEFSVQQTAQQEQTGEPAKQERQQQAAPTEQQAREETLSGDGGHTGDAAADAAYDAEMGNLDLIDIFGG